MARRPPTSPSVSTGKVALHYGTDGLLLLSFQIATIFIIYIFTGEKFRNDVVLSNLPFDLGVAIVFLNFSA